jgi:hypothetical protein
MCIITLHKEIVPLTIIMIIIIIIIITGSKFCKDQLMISMAVYEDFRRRKKYLNIAWIN